MAAVLEVRALEAGYGQARALFGVDLEVRQGEVVALLGRNGAGKTTTLKAVMGIVSPRGGQVLVEGRPVTGLRPWQLARLGIGYVPEDRRIFAELTVRENLELAYRPPRAGAAAVGGGAAAVGGGARAGGLGVTPAEVLATFPLLAPLQKRKGGLLSGGEQQLLTIARALVTNPRVLLLDEPTEGLAPVMVRSIEEVVLKLKASGLTVLLAEQNLRFASRVADRGYVLQKGEIQAAGTMEECARSEAVARLLAV